MSIPTTQQNIINIQHNFPFTQPNIPKKKNILIGHFMTKTFFICCPLVQIYLNLQKHIISFTDSQILKKQLLTT
jgi:hypothetical protein